MSSPRQDGNKDSGQRRAPAPQPSAAPPATEPEDSPEDQWESAEEIRQNSRTAQDRDHTIRRGDNVTTQTKEFPT